MIDLCFLQGKKGLAVLKSSMRQDYLYFKRKPGHFVLLTIYDFCEVYRLLR